MIKRKLLQLLMIGMLVILISSTFSVLAASNTVPISYAMDTTISIDQSQFIPPQCAGMSFDQIIYGSGRINGGPGNDLIYGSPGDDIIRGGAGDDCIVGGGGNDTLRGQNGNDVLIGGSGFDIIEGGPGYDICYYGDKVEDCETVY